MKQLFVVLCAVMVLSSCNVGKKEQKDCACEAKKVETCKEVKEMKKYTNDHFYDADGNLDAQKALDAYKEMLEYYNYPMDKFLAENMFISDFGLGDFANVGMAGVFWVNEVKDGYFAHEIFLLPGQMIAEHSHLATEMVKPKMESWHVRHGAIHTLGTAGEDYKDQVKLPESQKDYITVSKYGKVNQGEIGKLSAVETPHFMIGGCKGAIVAEYGTPHDGAALRFTNSNVVFTNVLENLK